MQPTKSLVLEGSNPSSLCGKAIILTNNTFAFTLLEIKGKCTVILYTVPDVLYDLLSKPHKDLPNANVCTVYRSKTNDLHTHKGFKLH